MWHVEKGITTSCHPLISPGRSKEVEWTEFMGFWKKVAYSVTEEEYAENWELFKEKYGAIEDGKIAQ